MGVEFGDVGEPAPTDKPAACGQRLQVALAAGGERCDGSHELAHERGGPRLCVDVDDLAAGRWFDGRRALVVEQADVAVRKPGGVVLVREGYARTEREGAALATQAPYHRARALVDLEQARGVARGDEQVAVGVGFHG